MTTPNSKQFIAEFEKKHWLSFLNSSITQIAEKLEVNFKALSQHSVQILVDELEKSFLQNIAVIIWSPFNQQYIAHDTARRIQDIQKLSENITILQDQRKALTAEKKTLPKVEADKIAWQILDINNAIQEATKQIEGHNLWLKQNEDVLKQNLEWVENALSFMTYYEEKILALKSYRDVCEEK